MGGGDKKEIKILAEMKKYKKWKKVVGVIKK